MVTNIRSIQGLLAEGRISCWVLYSAEYSDPLFAKLFGSISTPAVAVLSPDRCVVFVHALDADNLESTSDIQVVQYGAGVKLWEGVRQELERLQFPGAIALSYSTMQDVLTDVLGHGIYQYVTTRLRNIYRTAKQRVRFTSAERIRYAIQERKTERDIERLRLAAKRALEILETAFTRIRPGMTEQEAFGLVHTIAEDWPPYFAEQGVSGQTYAWEEAGCPIVLTGPNLEKGGHALPSSSQIEQGHTLYFDFGVTLHFADGERWTSDLQRMGYLLSPGETTPPKEVIDRFTTLVEAIDKGIQAIRPGQPGYRVDRVVRGYITECGYPDYNHGTGHPVGELAHDPGTALAPKGGSRSSLPIQLHGVYTIEPRIAVPNGGSIEEMVLVRESGGEALCSRQRTLYLI